MSCADRIDVMIGHDVGQEDQARPAASFQTEMSYDAPKIGSNIGPTISRSAGRQAGGTILDVINRGLKCCAMIPERKVSPRTAAAYRQAFVRMWNEPVLDALKEGIARDTYTFRRATLHFAGRSLLLELIDRCRLAAERNDPLTMPRLVAVLSRTLDRIEPALERDPPCRETGSTWQMPSSRWHADDKLRPRRGKNSKKHVLKRLPANWMDRLWIETPMDWPYRAPLAVHMVAPSRPEELVPGHRPHGWSPGAVVILRMSSLLEVVIAPAKTHEGKFGTPTATTKWDPVAEGGAAAYLAGLCAAAGGQIVVSISSKNAMRKAMKTLGERAFPALKGLVVITPYLIRNQVIADLKKTVGAGEQVATAAGHCTDKTQSRYGRTKHGRKRKGFLGAESTRKPRTSNVARGLKLAEMRKSIVARSGASGRECLDLKQRN